MIKLVVFDLWQTLAFRDVPKGSTDSMIQALDSPIPKKRFVKIFEESLQTKKWRSKKNAYANFCKNLGIPANAQNIFLLMGIRDKAERKTKLYPYTIPLLKRLQKPGFKIGVLSNSSIFAVQYVKKTRLLELIDYPIFSFQIGVIKPNPKFFRKMLATAHCKPQETVIIGDKFGDDVEPAQKLGMNAILFENYPKLKKDLKQFGIRV